MQGDAGSITFQEPVLDLTLTWIATSPAELWTNTGVVATDADFIIQTVSFPGSVTYIDWTNYFGESGIESMSYTVDPPAGVPEPGTWLLLGLGMGMVVLCFAWRELFRKRCRGCGDPVARGDESKHGLGECCPPLRSEDAAG